MKKGENPLAMRKNIGSVAELVVASKVMALGWRILFPFGENTRYDFVAERGGVYVRVQVKSAKPKHGALTMRCGSSNNWSVRSYTRDEVDCIAVYDSLHGDVYYVPISKVNKTAMNLRLEPSRNRQNMGVQYANDFREFAF